MIRAITVNESVAEHIALLRRWPASAVVVNWINRERERLYGKNKYRPHQGAAECERRRLRRRVWQ